LGTKNPQLEIDQGKSRLGGCVLACVMLSTVCNVMDTSTSYSNFS